jgi:hypothetical protein
MIYTDRDALLSAAVQLSADDTESLRRLGELFRVYYDALHSPPDGVIGVGAITYAEQKLIDYQMETHNG